MKKLIVLLMLVGGLYACNQPVQEVAESAEAVEPEEPMSQPIAFAEESFSEQCKQGLVAMTNKDTDGMLGNFADNAVWVFNNGDSIAGKQAISDYWSNRLTNAIDKLTFSNDVWLSLKVNESTQGVQTGNWVLGWATVEATYATTGKSMTQSVHMLYHFNDSGQTDRVIQFLDRAPIMAASTEG